MQLIFFLSPGKSILESLTQIIDTVAVSIIDQYILH